MKFINNVNETLRDDMAAEMKKGSKLSIAAAYFSIYAFEALRKELSNIDELRFIFTDPTFIQKENSKKEKREFYIPKLRRERGIYGTEFEVKLRNELNQKAIARECAAWVKNKAIFKSNVGNKDITVKFILLDDKAYFPVNGFTTVDLGCEQGNNMGTNIASIAKLGKGENITTGVLIKICEGLQCDLTDIMELVDSETKGPDYGIET